MRSGLVGVHQHMSPMTMPCSLMPCSPYFTRLCSLRASRCRVSCAPLRPIRMQPPSLVLLATVPLDAPLNDVVPCVQSHRAAAEALWLGSDGRAASAANEVVEVQARCKCSSKCLQEIFLKYTQACVSYIIKERQRKPPYLCYNCTPTPP